MQAFNSTVYDAAGSGNLQLLLSSLASYGHLIDSPFPDDRARRPLHHACMRGWTEAVLTLLRSERVSIDAPDLYGVTPTHLAARTGSLPVLEVLISWGSKAIDAPDHFGRTPLHLACQEGHTALVETLLRSGSSSLDKIDKKGNAPLHNAAKKDWPEIVTNLVRWGSQALDVRNHTGNTPLACALKNRSEGCVKALLALRATTGLSEEMLTLLNDFKVNEEEELAHRYRAYFSRSLTEVLVYSLRMSVSN